MNQVLDRYIIAPDFCLHQENLQTGQITSFNRKQLFDMIDYWKMLLVEKHQAQPGQKVLLEFNLTNIYYYSAIFAVWELGMVMIVDWPHAFSLEDATSYRMTMHGQLDFAIVYSRQTDPEDQEFYSYWDHERNRLNCRVILTEQDFDHYFIQDHDHFRGIAATIAAQPDMDAVWTASGGTTGQPQQIRITHKEIFLQAKRLCQHLNFLPGENSLHIANLHHGASMCYHFLPSFMTSTNHFIFNGHTNQNHSYYQDLSLYIKKRQINKILLYSSEKLINYLMTTPRLNHHLDIVTLFYVNAHCVQLLKEKNIGSIRNVFGDTTIGYGFLVKIVDQSTDPNTYDSKLIGPKLDEFFDFKIENGYLHVMARGLGETQWKTSYDKFELRDNNFWFFGRGNNYRIADEWINLGEMDAQAQKYFGDDGATVIIDNEEQQLYLSIWKPSKQGLEQFNTFLQEKFQHVRLNKIDQSLDPLQFTVSRKIDRQKLMLHFRNQPNLL